MASIVKTGNARRRGLPARPAPPRGISYVMRLGDGQTLFVEVPHRMTRVDRGGEVGFTPEGVRFLDRLRALASPLGRAPSPAYLAALREALGLTQEELGDRIGKSPMTISRWERGTMRPGRNSLAALGRVLAKAKRDGVVLPA